MRTPHRRPAGLTTSVIAVVKSVANLLIGLVASIYMLWSKDLFQAQAKKLIDPGGAAELLRRVACLGVLLLFLFQHRTEPGIDEFYERIEQECEHHTSILLVVIFTDIPGFFGVLKGFGAILSPLVAGRGESARKRLVPLQFIYTFRAAARSPRCADGI